MAIKIREAATPLPTWFLLTAFQPTIVTHLKREREEESLTDWLSPFLPKSQQSVKIVCQLYNQPTKQPLLLAYIFHPSFIPAFVTLSIQVVDSKTWWSLNFFHHCFSFTSILDSVSKICALCLSSSLLQLLFHHHSRWWRQLSLLCAKDLFPFTF